MLFITILYIFFACISVALTFINLNKITQNRRLSHRGIDTDSFRSFLFLFIFGLFVPVAEIFNNYFNLRAKSQLFEMTIFGTLILIIYLGLIFISKISKYYSFLIRTLYIIYLVFSTITIGDIYYPDNIVATMKAFELVVILFIGFFAYYAFKNFYLFAGIYFIFFLSFCNYYNLDYKLSIITFQVILVLVLISYIRSASENNRNINYYRSLNVINSQNIYIASISPTGKFEYINQSFENLFGSLSNLQKTSWEEFLGLGNVTNNVVKINFENNQNLFIEWRKTEKIFKNTIYFGFDVTDRQLIESDLKNSKQWLQTLIRNSADILLITDNNLIIKECFYNEKYANLIKLDLVLNKTIKRVQLSSKIQLSKDWYDTLEDKSNLAIETNSEVIYEGFSMTEEGISYHTIKISPIVYAPNVTPDLLINITVIDKIKYSEGPHYLKPIYEAVLNDSPSMIYCKNSKNIFQFVNENFGKYYGNNAFNFKSLKEKEIVKKATESYQAFELDNLKKNGGLYINEELRQNLEGQEEWFQEIKMLINIENNDYLIIGILNNINEHKHKESNYLNKIEDLQRFNFSKELKLTNYVNSLRLATEYLTELIESEENITPAKLHNLLRKLNEVLDEEESMWRDFKISFEQTNPNFFKKLIKICPELSPNELKHCGYIIANLNTKSMSKMLNLNIRSIHTVRYRIKKKLNLQEKVSLFDYLNNINISSSINHN